MEEFENSKLAESYFTDFLDKPLQNDENPHLLQLREEGKLSFLKTGIPDKKSEEWKYTPIRKYIDTLPVAGNGNLAGHIIGNGKKTLKPLKEEDGITLVIIDGQWIPSLSSPNTEENLEIIPFHEAETNAPALLGRIGKYAAMDMAFTALNTALFPDGLIIRVKENSQSSKPLHLVHYTLGTDSPVQHPRLYVDIGKGASATLVESFMANNGSSVTFNNSVTEIAVGENARLQHYYIHTESSSEVNLQHAHIHQEAGSNYSNFNFAFPGASLIRHDVHVGLSGSGAATNLYGFSLAAAGQLIDNHTRIDHLVPDCTSNELYKTIAKDEATVVFNGKVIVHPDAQRTSGFQRNNNIMLSDTATIYTKPQLEIYADDVKCSHGATLGQFDRDALFYLTARGIRDKTAKEILAHAFVTEIIEKIPDEHIREYINGLIADYFIFLS